MKDKVTPYDLIEERLSSMDKAMILQAKEYERRLEVLNHENERIDEVLKQSIPREIFEREKESLNAKIQFNTDYINAEKGRMRLERFIPWAIAVAALVISYLKK